MPRLLVGETGWMIPSLPEGRNSYSFLYFVCLVLKPELSFPDKGTVTSAREARDKPVHPCAKERLL